MKLLGSVRGSGAFSSEEGSVSVDYQLDTYEERNRKSLSGSLDGDLSFAEDKAVGALKLASGEEIKVILVKPDDEGADFQAV